MPIATVPPELEIPAIDLSPDSPQTDEERAATLLKALNTVGFLFVLNPHADLDVAHVRDIFSAGEELFSVPLEAKEAVPMDLASGAGYTSMMGQTTGDRSERVRGDIKESFSIGSDTLASIPSASAALAPRLNAFRQACFACGTRLLDLFTIALGYPEGDDRYFSRRHTYGHNESLRLINYPAFPRAKADEVEKQGGQTRWDELKIGEKDLRAGAHQDFGSA